MPEQASVIVASCSTAAVVYSRSAGVAYFILASAACSITVKIIKRLIGQARPSPKSVIVHVKAREGYGMPSTHAAVVSFQAAYILLACLALPIHPAFPQSVASRLLPPLVIIPWAITIVVSRVKLGYHTWAQVVVGFLYGICAAAVMFALWKNSWKDSYGALADRYIQHMSNSTLRPYQ
ncbi:hypothetical protein NMY22_g10687 [Coprinellus aureogranulatus]|nr:hypothetical protein NMY22_g10687 [Coprinellus aureogranulatus]